jgi:hypothetical protein
MSQKMISVGLLVCLCANITTFAAHSRWPKVQPLERAFHLSDGTKRGEHLTIFGEDKKPLYLLQCYINAQDVTDKDFDWGGDFECRLTPLPVDKYAHKNLLTDERSTRDWDTRAVFQIPEELMLIKVEGVPIQYPGRGKARLFKLRGMDIEISVTDFTFGPRRRGQHQRVSSLNFKVVIGSDTTAHSSADEPLNYSDSLYSSIRWPEIASSHKKIRFAGHQLTKISILGRNRKPLYDLYCCLNPNFPADTANERIFSGDFHCFLFSRYDFDGSQGYLLCDDPYPTVEGQGRGRFWIGDITGKCGDYPDYGKIREFRLRGMDLTLSIARFELVSSRVGSDSEETKIRTLDLEVTATPDFTAIGDIAAQSKYMPPAVPDPQNPNRYIQNCDSIRVRTRPGFLDPIDLGP